MNTRFALAALGAFGLLACEKSAPATPTEQAGQIVLQPVHAAPATPCLARALRAPRGINSAGYFDISTALDVTPARTPAPTLCATWTITPYQLVSAGWQAQDEIPPYTFESTRFDTTQDGGVCESSFDTIVGCDSSWPDAVVNGATANVGYVATASQFNDCNGNPVAATPMTMVVTTTAECVAGLDVPVEFVFQSACLDEKKAKLTGRRGGWEVFVLWA